MKENKMQAILDLREGGDEWLRKHVLPPKPSQGHQREEDQLCVCVCLCVVVFVCVQTNSWELE